MLDGDGECALLVADSTLGADGLHVERVVATGQILEGHTVSQCITIAPVFVEAFHPVHELQTLALVVVTARELDGEGVLIMSQYEVVGLVECLRQYGTVVILMSGENLLLANEELCEHYARQGVVLAVGALELPVHAEETTQQYVSVLTGEDGTGVELVALQTVGCGIVVETVVVSAVLMVTLDDDTAHTTAGGHPDIVVLIFGDTTDVIVRQTLFLGQITQVVVFHVQDVQTLAGTYPKQTSGVLQYLGDEVVGERLHVGHITRQHLLLSGREIQDDQALSGSDVEVVVLSLEVIVEAGDVVRGQFTVLTGVRRERVHLRVIHLQTTVSGNPEVTYLISTQVVDVVVDQCLGAVLGQ